MDNSEQIAREQRADFAEDMRMIYKEYQSAAKIRDPAEREAVQTEILRRRAKLESLFKKSIGFRTSPEHAALAAAASWSRGVDAQEEK